MSDDHRGNTELQEERMFQNRNYHSQATVCLLCHTTSTETNKERIKQQLQGGKVQILPSRDSFWAFSPVKNSTAS